MKFLAGLLGGACALLLSSCAEYYAYETGYGGGYTDSTVAIQSGAGYGNYEYSSPVRSFVPLGQSYVRPVSSYYEGNSCSYDRGRSDCGGGYRRRSWSDCDGGRYY